MVELITLPVWQTIAQSSGALTVPADTTEDTLVSVTIPAGRMGPNGRLRTWVLWSSTNSANNKTGRVKFNGTSFGTIAWTANATFIDQRALGNRNSQSSQVATPTGTSGGVGATTALAVTMAVDTSVDTTLTITGQKASAGESLVLESYIIELLYGA